MSKKLKIGATIVVCAVLLGIIMITVLGFALSSETYLQDKQYDTIGELHNDLVLETQKQANNSVDFFPTELVGFCQIEDKYFTFSKYSSTNGGEEVDGCLYVNVVKETSGKFILETPTEGLGKFAEIKLTDFSDNLNWRYYVTCQLNGKEKSICFLYKAYTEQRKLTFDGMPTTELELINPFSGEKFYLCYAVSSADSFFNKFKSFQNRHKVEFVNA